MKIKKVLFSIAYTVILMSQSSLFAKAKASYPNWDKPIPPKNHSLESVFYCSYDSNVSGKGYQYDDGFLIGKTYYRSEYTGAYCEGSPYVEHYLTPTAAAYAEDAVTFTFAKATTLEFSIASTLTTSISEKVVLSTIQTAFTQTTTLKYSTNYTEGFSYTITTTRGENQRLALLTRMSFYEVMEYKSKSSSGPWNQRSKAYVTKIPTDWIQYDGVDYGSTLVDAALLVNKGPYVEKNYVESLIKKDQDLTALISYLGGWA